MGALPNSSEALERAVILRLQSKVPDLCIEAFPDDPDEYRLNHPVGAALVRYHGSKFGSPMDTGILAQERVMAFEVTLVMRQLSGGDGVYAALERVRLALAGYLPLGFAKIRPINEEFVSQGGGEWRYAIDFVTSTLAIEDEDQDDLPLVKKITVLAKDGHEKVQVPRAG